MVPSCAFPPVWGRPRGAGDTLAPAPGSASYARSQWRPPVTLRAGQIVLRHAHLQGRRVPEMISPDGGPAPGLQHDTEVNRSRTPSPPALTIGS